MSTDWLPFILQTTDPLFPTGAYAHSSGLEEIVRLNCVRDEAGLRDFLKTQIRPALEHFELPFVRFACDAAVRRDVEGLVALNAELDAAKICRELREASIQLGTRRLETLLKVTQEPVLQRLAQHEVRPHHAVVFGAQMMAVPLEAALGAYFYLTFAGYCSAALKLIRIGQEGCQRVLSDCLNTAAETVCKSLEVERDDAGWFNPLLEIASMRHEQAFERMFIS